VKAVNLIPSEQRAGGGPAAGQSEGAAFMVLGLLAGVAVLALLYGIASHQVSDRKDKVASVNAQAQAIQARANELAPYTSFKSMYEQRLSAVSELVNTRFDWAHAFHELGRVLPTDASLNSVKGTIGAAGATAGASASSAPAASAATAAASAGSVTSATPPGSVPSFVLAGCATSQSEVAQTIQRLRLIDGVSAVVLQSSTKGSSGSSSSGSSGSCPEKDPAFAMTVTFTALPAPAATPAPKAGGSAESTAATGTAGSSAPTTTPVASTGGSQ
jgi:Tfp pilus assembly protein PilN